MNKEKIKKIIISIIEEHRFFNSMSQLFGKALNSNNYL